MHETPGVGNFPRSISPLAPLTREPVEQAARNHHAARRGIANDTRVTDWSGSFASLLILIGAFQEARCVSGSDRCENQGA